MVPAKARPVNFVLRSPWSARESPPQDLGYPVNPGNVDEGQGDHTSTRRRVRGSDSKNRVSKHEVHEPSIYDENPPSVTKEVGTYDRILNIFTGSIEDRCVEMENVHVFVNESSHSS